MASRGGCDAAGAAVAPAGTRGPAGRRFGPRRGGRRRCVEPGPGSEAGADRRRRPARGHARVVRGQRASRRRGHAYGRRKVAGNSRPGGTGRRRRVPPRHVPRGRDRGLRHGHDQPGPGTGGRRALGPVAAWGAEPALEDHPRHRPAGLRGRRHGPGGAQRDGPRRAARGHGPAAPGPGVTPQLVAFTRRRLFVGPERDAEIEGWLCAREPREHRVAALWWSGAA